MGNIETFRSQYLSGILSDASMAGITLRECFLTETTRELSASDICPEAEPCMFTGTGKHGRISLVHGFADTDGESGLRDSTLNLFVCDFSGEAAPSNFTESEFNTLAKRCIAFIDDSVSGLVESTANPSQPGYGLARNIRMRYRSYDRIFIYVVTDRFRGDRFGEIKDRDLEGKPVFMRLIDMTLIYDVFNKTDSGDDRVIRVSDFGFSSIPCVKAGSFEGYTSYIGAIPGLFLALVYRDYGSRLLESNVRSFLTVKNKVNNGIRTTVRENPGMFFAYNNGVSLTASDAEVDSSGIKSFTNLQIVNGGQTTVTLFKELKTKFSDRLSEVYVPMKLTVVKGKDPTDAVRNISVYLNTQTAVSDSDLASNSAFQVAMEKASRECVIPDTGGKWYYERARGQFDQDVSKAGDSARFKLVYDRGRRLDKIELARMRYIRDLKPYIVSKGGQTCFSYFSNEINSLFADNPSLYGEDYFRESVAFKILYDSVYKRLSGESWFEGYLKPQICAYAISKTVLMLSDMGYAINTQSIWKDQSADPALIDQAISAAKVFQTHLSGISRVGGNATQECRRQSCWDTFSSMDVPLGSRVADFCVPISRSSARTVPALSASDADDSVLALKSFSDWKKIKYLLLRQGADKKDIDLIQEVIDYLDDPRRSMPPSRAKQALEIRKRFV